MFQLLPAFISGDSPGSASLLKRTWELQPGAVMRAMVQLHTAQPQSLLRLLDLAQSFGALGEVCRRWRPHRGRSKARARTHVRTQPTTAQVLQLRAFSFTLDLAAVAQRKDLITLEPWASASLAADAASRSSSFASACLAYIREKLLAPVGAASRISLGGGANVNVLSADAAAAIFRALFAAPLPAAISTELSQLFKLCVSAKPKLQGLCNLDAFPKAPVVLPAAAAAAPPPPLSAEQLMAPASPVIDGDAGSSPLGAAGAIGCLGVANAGPAPLPGMPGGAEIAFASGIEEEANSYFQRIYTVCANLNAPFVSSAVRPERRLAYPPSPPTRAAGRLVDRRRYRHAAPLPGLRPAAGATSLCVHDPQPLRRVPLLPQGLTPRRT